MTKKLTGLVLTLVMCLALCVPAFAANANTSSLRSHIFISQSYNGSFDKAWEKTYSESALDGSTWYPMKITYGYNTVLINEDYCWAYSNDYLHWARLSNGSGSHTGGTVLAGMTSKIEVTHSGSSISYSCNIN